MRFLVALTVAILAVPALASADSQGEPRDALAMTLLRVSGKGVYAEWTPAPGGLLYTIYRGPSPDALTLIGQTVATTYWDPDAPEEDTWYVVVGSPPLSALDQLIGRVRGACVSHSGTGIAITASHCIPMGAA